MPTIVSSGMYISGAVIAGGGAGPDALYCYKHGVVSSATVSSGGTMYVSGGAVKDVVARQGTISAISGAYINNMYLTSGGSCSIQSSVVVNAQQDTFYGRATDILVNTGGVLLNAIITVAARIFTYADTYVGNVTLCSSGYLCTAGTGNVDNVLASGRNAHIFHRGRGTINGAIVVGSNTRFTMATNVDTATVGSRHTAYNVILSSGAIGNISGGQCSNWTISSGASAYVSGGATMYNTIVVGGGTIFVESGGVMSNTSCISAGQIFINSGGIYRGGLLSERVGNNMQLGLQGGTIDGCTVTSSAWLRWWHGIVRNIIVESGGIASDDNNQNQITTIENVTVLPKGSAVVTQSRTIQHVNIASTGRLDLTSGACGRDIHATGSGALVVLRHGVTIDDLKLLGPAQCVVSSNCTINNIYINENSSSTVTNLVTYGAVVINGITCHSGATANINSGAICSGGHVQYPTNTCIYSRDGGLVVDCWAHENGYVWITPGGVGSGGGAYSMTGSAKGGNYIVYGSAYDLMCSSAGIYARNSGTTIGIISGVDVYPGGILYCNGGTTYNAVLHSGGSASTSSGSCLNIIRYGGAKVTSNVDTDIITYGPEPSLIGHGLVYWLDALNNTGKGYMDKEATTWIDMCNTGNNTPINLAYAMWDGNRCLQTVDGFTTARSNRIFTADGPWTIESITEVPDTVNTWAVDMRTGTSSPTPSGLGVQITRHSDTGCTGISYFVGAGDSFLRSSSDGRLAILTCTIDANKLVTLYVNGVATTSTTTTGTTIRPVNRALRLFAYADIAAYSHAGTAVYAVHIYNRALTAAEVAANYAYGCSRYNLNLN